MHDQMVYGHGFQVQACSLMYKKILRLNQNGISQVSIGKIVNIMSNDVIRYNYCLIVGFQGIMAPIVIGVRKESKIFSPTLAELDIALAGRWSLWRPFSFNLPYPDLSEFLTLDDLE